MKDLKKFIETAIKEYLNENTLGVLQNGKKIKDILLKLNISNYKILGTGQHGIAIHNLTNNKVYKLTISKHEIKIANLLLNKNFVSLPFIYEIGNVDGFDYYVRDMFFEIDEEFGEKIYEEIEDIKIFFYEKNMDVRKSNTNLRDYFDDKFLKFLNNLKMDLFIIGIKDDFDIQGLSLNIALDKSNNFILIDF